MHRNYRPRFAIALVAAAVAALSCRSGDSTGPAALLPVDSLPKLTIGLPPNQAMTSATSELITITGVNLKPRSCSITGPGWLGLMSGINPNASWTVTPTSSGSAVLFTSCSDLRNAVVISTDTLQVYNQPTVSPDISGIVPVDVGDSINVSYDSTDTQRIDVACVNCATYATMTRVGANTIGLTAKAVTRDTTHRGICFTVHGLDGRYTQQQCVTVSIMPPQAALYSVPTAIRIAEVVPLHTIPVATYDKMNQSNHPDFMRVGASWSKGTCWMVFTPYFGSNGAIENPSLATSPDCEHWTPAAGVRAPLIDQPGNGYNSDPELMYDSQRGCLGVVFRQVTTQNTIQLASTCDGKNFSAPRQLVAAPNHKAISPTVALGPDGFNRMFYVDAGAAGCTSQTNVVKMRVATSDTADLASINFGPEVVTDLVQPGYVVWHIKVRYVAALKEYIAMYAAFPTSTGIGDCTDDDLYIATSADGLHWTSFQSPVLDHLDRRFNFITLYRASFQYDSKTDQLRTIVSALDQGNWGQFGVVHNFTALMGALNSANTVAAAQLIPSPRLVRKAVMRTRKVVIEDQP